MECDYSCNFEAFSEEEERNKVPKKKIAGIAYFGHDFSKKKAQTSNMEEENGGRPGNFRYGTVSVLKYPWYPEV